jgi:hypothetical protein
MKYTIALASRKDESLAAQTKTIELGKKGERPTEVLGNALKAVLKWVKSYKSPFITITREDGEVVEAYAIKGTGLARFTEANMAAIAAICMDLVPIETMLTMGHIKDPLILEFMHTLGLLPKEVKSVSVAKMEEDINAKWKSFKDILRYAKAEAKDKVYLAHTPQQVLTWKEAAKAQKQKVETLLINETATA